ncbi:hypothetical protein HD554DRAFT_2039097 [Boletus coccyginus]|nr:hypothetical protein HD554DRAFT_2039097 [Boletus coccyginus]
MPDLTIINNLDEAVHVAFFITVPTHWKNNLQPGERWTTHLPTLPLYFQARWFCPGESWEAGAMIGKACAAGTAAVVIGAMSLFRDLGAIGVTLPAGLVAVTYAAGAKYAAMDSDTKLCETRVWVPWFEHKEYSVGMVGKDQCVLWDVKENRQALQPAWTSEFVGTGDSVTSLDWTRTTQRQGSKGSESTPEIEQYKVYEHATVPNNSGWNERPSALKTLFLADVR